VRLFPYEIGWGLFALLKFMGMLSHTFQYITLITPKFDHVQSGGNDKEQLGVRMEKQIKENLKEILKRYTQQKRNK